jgi:hypothetical protein
MKLIVVTVGALAWFPIRVFFIILFVAESTPFTTRTEAGIYSTTF